MVLSGPTGLSLLQMILGRAGVVRGETPLLRRHQTGTINSPVGLGGSGYCRAPHQSLRRSLYNRGAPDPVGGRPPTGGVMYVAGGIPQYKAGGI